MPAERLGQPPPIVQALLLADHIYTDPGTGKRYILGTYNRMMATKFPHVVPKLCLFLALTGGHGSIILRLRIVDMDEERGPLLESAQPANMANPNDIYYFPITLSVVFPAPGAYRIQVFADNDLLRELCLQITARQEKPHAPNEP
jgi:hypothetical protein